MYPPIHVLAPNDITQPSVCFFILDIKRAPKYANAQTIFPSSRLSSSLAKHLLQPGFSAAPTAVVDKATRPAYNGTELARTSMLQPENQAERNMLDIFIWRAVFQRSISNFQSGRRPASFKICRTAKSHTHVAFFCFEKMRPNTTETE
jgi:hypothetical protein